uniref:Uncharacterized protein n=1 Tax=Rhipicephalus appendiculatus TaxID=34631 RepID=A0A131YF80_RHIAP
MALGNIVLGIFLIAFAATATAIKRPRTPKIFGALCNTTRQCNIGQKLACLTIRRGKLIECIPHYESCEDHWEYYCQRPYTPICKNMPTECKCCCGSKSGWLSRALRMCF